MLGEDDGGGGGVPEAPVGEADIAHVEELCWRGGGMMGVVTHGLLALLCCCRGWRGLSVDRAPEVRDGTFSPQPAERAERLKRAEVRFVPLDLGFRVVTLGTDNRLASSS